MKRALGINDIPEPEEEEQDASPQNIVKTKAKESHGEDGFSLSDKKRITVSDYKGKTLVQIREYYEKDGKMLPGKKGIALSVADWERVKSLVDAVDEEIKRHRSNK